MQAAYHFIFSEDYLLTSLLRYRQQVWWRRPFLQFKWLLVFLLGVSVVFFSFTGMPFLAGTSGAIVGALLLGWLIDAWLTRRSFRKSPFHNDEIKFLIAQSGVLVWGRNSESQINWANFTKARRFKDGLMLFQGPNVLNWLPDTTAADPTTVAMAQELARSNIQDYRAVEQSAPYRCTATAMHRLGKK